MSIRTKQVTMYVTDEESKKVTRMIMEQSLKDNTKYSISDWLRSIVFNGNAPPPDIIDDCVKEKIVEMETEDNKQGKQWNDEPVVSSFIEQVLQQERTQDDEQDAKQLAINDSKQDDEQEATDYWEGITT